MKLFGNPLIYIFFFFSYTDLPLPIGGGIPSFFLIVILAGFIFFRLEMLSLHDWLFVFFLFWLIVCGAFLSPELELSSIFAKLKGVSLLMFSFLTGIFFSKLLDGLSSDQVLSFVQTSLFAIIIGSFLEVVGVIDQISNTFRVLFYQNSLYAGDLRDLYFTGHIRPKLFTSEPSHVTKAFMLLCCSWYLLRPLSKVFLLSIIFHLYMLWAQASPIVVLSLIFLFFIHLLISKRKVLVFGLLAMSLILLVSLAIVYSDEIIQLGALVTRVEQATEGDDGSINQRFIYPLITFFDVIKCYPIFGIGILNKEVILNVTSFVHENDPNQILGNNAFFNSISYFGLIGVLSFIVTFYFYVKNLMSPSKVLMFFAFFFIYSFATGAFVTPRYWVFVCLFLVSLKKSDEF